MKVDILLIQEVKMTLSNVKSIASYIWLGANFCYNEAEGVLGGVATFWNQSVSKGNFIHCSKDYLSTKHRKDDKTWNVINVYAPNSR